MPAFVLQGWGSGLGMDSPTERMDQCPQIYVSNQVLSSWLKKLDLSRVGHPSPAPPNTSQPPNHPLKECRPFCVCIYRLATGIQGLIFKDNFRLLPKAVVNSLVCHALTLHPTLTQSLTPYFVNIKEILIPY